MLWGNTQMFTKESAELFIQFPSLYDFILDKYLADIGKR